MSHNIAYLSNKKAPNRCSARPSRVRGSYSGQRHSPVNKRCYMDSPQEGPSSMSHLLGTSRGRTFSIMLAIFFASSTLFTDIAISSWICTKGKFPLLCRATIAFKCWTAWSPPVPVWDRLTGLGFDISASYVDEGGMFKGAYIFGRS